MKAKPVPILHTIAPGGSGQGLSYWTEWILCGRRAQLNAESSAFGGGMAADDNLLLGTIYHAFHEIAGKRHDSAFDTALVEFSTEGSADRIEQLRATAEQLFRAHRTLFPLGREGKLLACEEIVVAKGPQDWLPDGITKFPIKPDRIIKVLTEHSMWLRGTRGINVPPGRYILDFKTDGSWKGTEDKYQYDLRFPLYELAWNAARPKEPVNGVLVDIAYKPGKTARAPSFNMVLVKAQPVDTLRVRALLDLAYARHIEDPPRANPMACFPWGKACSHLVSGRCQRY